MPSPWQLLGPPVAMEIKSVCLALCLFMSVFLKNSLVRGSLSMQTQNLSTTDLIASCPPNLSQRLLFQAIEYLNIQLKFSTKQSIQKSSVSPVSKYGLEICQRRPPHAKMDGDLVYLCVFGSGLGEETICCRFTVLQAVQRAEVYEWKDGKMPLSSFRNIENMEQVWLKIKKWPVGEGGSYQYKNEESQLGDILRVGACGYGCEQQRTHQGKC